MSKKIDWNDPKARISKYFIVWEVTKGDPRRRPVPGSEVEKNILKLAIELDKVREEWGSPILVTSWYRPAAINAKVGGSVNPPSRHIFGQAADIKPVNYGSLAKFQAWLDQHWYGALGYGARRGFVHLDTRNGKGWRSGGEKGPRWNY